MLTASFKRTKIVATIGPATYPPHILEQLVLAGCNAFRLNLAHGTHEEHAAVVKAARGIGEKHSRPVAIIADLQGPKIRTGTVPSDGLPFVRDTVVRFEYGASYESTGVVPVQYDISKYVKKGQRIFLRDGQIQVVVEKVERKLISCKVVTAGLLYSNQGMNLPDTDLAGDILTDKDLRDIEFAAENGADYIALSFVQTADDVLKLRKKLDALKIDIKVIAKIETAAAVANVEEIVRVSDGLMAARGDLAVETKPEAVPSVQRQMIELAKQYRRPVIVATQMLESMMQSPQPTRAEVSDVATAVLEGADAVMLSGETAMGLFPVETVKMMKRIILYTEHEQLTRLGPLDEADFGELEQQNAISAAAVVLARQLPAKVIIAETNTGQTARNIAALRPGVPIVMATNHPRVYNQLAIVWGGKSFLSDQPEAGADYVIKQLLSAGNVLRGDAVVVASGHQPGITGGTDTVSLKIA